MSISRKYVDKRITKTECGHVTIFGANMLVLDVSTGFFFSCSSIENQNRRNTSDR